MGRHGIRIGLLALAVYLPLAGGSPAFADEGLSWDTVLEVERLRQVSDAIQRLPPKATRALAVDALRDEGLLPRAWGEAIAERGDCEWVFRLAVGPKAREQFRLSERISDVSAFAGPRLRIGLHFDAADLATQKSWAVGGGAVTRMPRQPPSSMRVWALDPDPDAYPLPTFVTSRAARPGDASDFERIAKRVDRLEPGIVIYSRDLGATPPAQSRAHRDRVLLSWLFAVPHPVPALTKLAAHELPRVRTLALLGLMLADDHRVLPTIARLAEDNAPTFGYTAAWSIAGGQYWLETVPVVRATVSWFARHCLKQWTGEHRAAHSREGWEKYWALRRDRAYCAGWFKSRLERATKASSPIAESRHPRIRALFQEVLQLPSPDRELITLSVFSRVGDIVGVERIKAAGPRLGLENLRAIAAGKVITDDPDFQPHEPGGRGGYQSTVMNAVLRHAHAWFLPEDADLVLALGQSMGSALGAVQAGFLDPARSRAVLEAAWEHDWPAYRLQQARFELIKGMWNQLGTSKADLIVNWYYETYALGRHHSTPVHDLPRFLLDRGRSRDRALLKRVILDERFKQVDDEMTIIYLVMALNEYRHAQLGGVELYSSDVRGKEAHWRALIRKTMREDRRFRDL